MRGRGAVPGRLRRSPPPGSALGWATLRLGAGYGYYVGAGLRARTARARVCVRSASLLGGCVCVSRLYTLRFTLSVTVWQEPPCTHRVQGRVRVGAVGEGVASEAWPRGRQTAGGRPARPRAHWLPASPRATRSAPMAIGVGALRARVPEAAGSLPRATRSAPKAWALRARAPTCVCSPPVAHVVFWGWCCGMSMTSCAARCLRGSVQGVLRAPAEGEGGVAHREAPK